MAVSFAASVSDADVPADWLSVEWASDKDGAIGNSTPTSVGEVSFSYAGLSVDSHNITMTVRDEVGATCTTAIDYTVGTAPTVQITSPVAGSTTTAGQLLDFSVAVSDAQDQPESIALEWVLDGVLFSSQTPCQIVAQFSDSTLVYGTHTLLVTATDSDGLNTADQVSFIINALPSAPAVSINPSPAATSDAR